MGTPVRPHEDHSQGKQHGACLRPLNLLALLCWGEGDWEGTLRRQRWGGAIEGAGGRECKGNIREHGRGERHVDIYMYAIHMYSIQGKYMQSMQML